MGQLLLAVTLGLGSFGTVYGAQDLKWERVPLEIQLADDVIYMPGHTALRASSLGYRAFAADLVFIRAHAYLLKHFYSDRIFSWLETYVAAAVALDPDNRELYCWASTVIRLGQEIDETTIADSNRFASMGAVRFPDDPRFYEMMAFNRYFELRPRIRARETALATELEKAPSERRERLLAELSAVRRERYATERDALNDYTIAAMLPGSEVDPLFLVNLYVRQDELGAARNLTRALVADAPPEVRASLLANLEAIGDTELASQLRSLDDRHTAEAPFMSPDLFAMIGSQADAGLPTDWNRLGSAVQGALESLESRQTETESPE